MPGWSSSARAWRSLVQRPCLAQRRNWRDAVSGLPKRSGSACQGGGARPGRVWAASQKTASSLARGSRTGRPAGRRAGRSGGFGVLGGRERGLAPRLLLGLGGAEEEG